MTFVIPQAIESFRPAITAGTPAIDMPRTCSPGAFISSSYQREGDSSSRCVSFASIAPPVAERRGATAQALLPPLNDAVPENAAYACAARR